MEINSQHHAPDALVPRKVSPGQILLEVGWAPESAWT